MAQDPTHKAVREVLARAVSEPGAVIDALGEPKRGEVQNIHQSPELTIINVVWAPYMTVMPHNHEMWAVIGIYTGREDNMFWRRIDDGADGRQNRGGRRDGYVRQGRHSARCRHHPFGDQPDPGG